MFIKPLNSTFWLVFAFFIALLLVATLILKDKARKTKRQVLGIAMFLVFVYYWFYKYSISIDNEYIEIRNLAGIGAEKFTWFAELPLHLCNINLMLIPVACLTDNKRLYAFCFFSAPLGAIMALLMPGAGFEEGYSLFTPRILGFYITHFMVLIGGIAILSFGLYKPTYRDAIPTAVSILFVSLIVFGINMLLRKTGAYAYANYFFNVTTEENPILEIFYKLVPIPYVYQLSMTLVLIPYILLITTLVNLPSMIKEKRTAAIAETEIG